ncbi:MAG: pyruvate dehydrogenase (acetyl-transferring) E1 component subunit alpha, partial [Pseudomonadota bacterium]
MARQAQTTRRKPSSKSKTADAPALAELTAEDELQAYRDMLLIRRFEERAGQMYGMGLIGGFCHLY